MKMLHEDIALRRRYNAFMTSRDLSNSNYAAAIVYALIHRDGVHSSLAITSTSLINIETTLILHFHQNCFNKDV